MTISHDPSSMLYNSVHLSPPFLIALTVISDACVSPRHGIVIVAIMPWWVMVTEESYQGPSCRDLCGSVSLVADSDSV